MTAKIHLGSSDGPTLMGLTDICSNTGLIDKQLLLNNYPNAQIHPRSISLTGIGENKTVGWIVVPIWIDCTDSKGDLVSVQLDIELHVMENFSAGLLLGLDAILDYDIDISMGHKEAYLIDPDSPRKKEVLKFPLFCPPQKKFQKVIIKSSERVVIGRNETYAIGIKSAMLPGIDYFFTPRLTTPRGLQMEPQFANGTISTDRDFLMFTNFTNHPVEVQKGQALGDAEAALFGNMAFNIGIYMDWADLLRPAKRSPTTGTRPPRYSSIDRAGDPETHYEDLLCFDSYGREKPRPPRSISEEEVQRILLTAEQRKKGDRFPNEDEDEHIPLAPIPESLEKGTTQTSAIADISPHLSEYQKRELQTLISDFPEAFSDGSTIGSIDPSFHIAEIDLTEPLPPPQPNRPVGPGKRAVIDETMETLIGWDIIEPSNSPTASAVVLVWQNGKWRFCVDFRQLNAVTKGDAYPMLRADYVFSALADKRYFTMLDAVKGYHQMDLREEDRMKTAFISHRGLYQYKKLPFGLKNAPAIFQRMMDKLLGSLRWQAALVYIDDVIIFSSTWPEHIAHLRTILQSATKIGLRFHLSKCRFGYANLQLLGMGLSRYGLHTIEEKVKAISDLSPPQTIGEVHRLVGMFSYYRNFINNFAKIAAPLHDLKKNKGGSSEYNARQSIDWSDECQRSFEELKSRLSSAPILAHPKFDGRPFILYSDASKIAFGAVLVQTWSHSNYNLDEDPGGEPEDQDPPTMTTFINIAEDSWKTDYIADPVFRPRYKKLLLQATAKEPLPVEEDGFFIAQDETLRYNTIYGERICLPAARIPDALKTSHDVLGHFGAKKTYERLAETYYRPKLSSIVTTYVRHCPKCAVNKTTRAKLPGSLSPIDVPRDAERIPSAFEAVNINLIVGLPKSQGFDAILVIVNRFTKTGIFTPTTSDFTAESIANVFMEKVVARGFLPSKFITDRDPRLITSFWKTMCRRLNIDHRKTAAWHAQCDGAAERLNQTLEIALRNYVSPRQHDWSKHLFLIELAYNTAKNTTTGFAPYQLLYSQPQNPVERLLRPNIPPAAEDFDMDVSGLADDIMLQNAAILQEAQQAIVKATDAQKQFYDRRHGPIPKYKVGDYASIHLDRHPISIIKRNKLSQQKLPPYRITRIVSEGRAVELNIPSNITIHPVISVQHLEPAPAPREDPWKRSESDTAGAMTIVNHRETRGGNRKFRVHWENLGADRDEWRNRKRIDEDLVRAYEDSLQQQALTVTAKSFDSIPRRTVDTPFEYPTKAPTKGSTIERPVLYISRATKPYEKSYEATELELGCISWAMMRLRHYVEGSKV